MKDMTGDWVVAGNLICVPMPVPMQILEDIKSALLFAQLTADDKYPNGRSSSKWFAEHTKALTFLKWVGVESESHSVEVDDEGVVNIGSIVDQFLPDGAESEHVGHVQQALACLGEHADMQAHILFRSFALVEPLTDEQEGDASGTEITAALFVSVLRPGAVMESLWVTFTTVARLTDDFIRQPFNGAQLRGAVQVRRFQRQWNAAGYSTVRAKVESYLASRRADLIMPLECSDELTQN